LQPEQAPDRGHAHRREEGQGQLSERPVAGPLPEPAPEEGGHLRLEGDGLVAVVVDPDLVAAVRPPLRLLDLPDEPGAGRRLEGDELRQEPRQANGAGLAEDRLQGRRRGAGLGGGHDEREQTLNQLLVEMDGFELKDNIILIAATNRPDILDPALLRPGRFDRQIVVDRPDRNGRRKILEVHAKGKPLASEIDLDTLAAGTPGFTGADLANLVNEAALLAARRGKKVIEQEELEEGIMRVLAGPEKKARLLSEEERKITAYR